MNHMTDASFGVNSTKNMINLKEKREKYNDNLFTFDLSHQCLFIYYEIVSMVTKRERRRIIVVAIAITKKNKTYELMGVKCHF